MPPPPGSYAPASPDALRRSLSTIDWLYLELFENIHDKHRTTSIKMILMRLDIIMPAKLIKLHLKYSLIFNRRFNQSDDLLWTIFWMNTVLVRGNTTEY